MGTIFQIYNKNNNNDNNNGYNIFRIQYNNQRIIINSVKYV